MTPEELEAFRPPIRTLPGCPLNRAVSTLRNVLAGKFSLHLKPINTYGSDDRTIILQQIRRYEYTISAGTVPSVDYDIFAELARRMAVTRLTPSQDKPQDLAVLLADDVSAMLRKEPNIKLVYQQPNTCYPHTLIFIRRYPENFP